MLPFVNRIPSNHTGTFLSFVVSGTGRIVVRRKMRTRYLVVKNSGSLFLVFRVPSRGYFSHNEQRSLVNSKKEKRFQ